jgi:aminoacyl tRNA synthase complex-interacting multifunctional protein 1
MTPAATLTVGRGFAPAPRRARALPRERPRARGPLLRASEEEHDKARDILDADREKFLGDTASAEKPKFDVDAVGQELYDDFKVELAKWRAKRDEELKDEPPFVSTIEERLAAALAEDTTLPPNPNPIPIPPLPDLRRVLLTLVPIRPRRRGERRSLRTFPPGDSLRPSPLAFDPDTPRRRPFNSASDAFELHPDIIALCGPSTLRELAKISNLELTDEEIEEWTPQVHGIIDWFGKLNDIDIEKITSDLETETGLYRDDWSMPLADDVTFDFENREAMMNEAGDNWQKPYVRVPKVDVKENAEMMSVAEDVAAATATATAKAEEKEAEVRSIHWSPYDRVGVVNAVP